MAPVRYETVGLATAGGMEVVPAADVVVATTRSSFGLAEVRHNLVAAAGGLFRLPRAHQLGLVSRVAEPAAALDMAMEVARAVVAAAPLAVQASLRIVRDASVADDDTLRERRGR